MKFQFLIFLFLTPVFFAACTDDKLVDADIQETAQQIGDVMASFDESGATTNGSMAFMEGQRKYMAVKDKQLPANLVTDVFNLFTPIKSAQATSCKDTTFSACASSTRVRDLNGCTLGSTEFTGNITLHFNNGSCAINANGNSVHRVPDFTITGRREATLTVSKTGTNGQTITNTGSGFTFTNDGTRRVFNAGGVDLFDFTTVTMTAITVTGTTRADRVMTGGILRVTNNDSNVTCNFSPNNVAWSANCNCASSGSWSGSCSDGKTSSLTLTGCGTATFKVDDDSENLKFDRCYSN